MSGVKKFEIEISPAIPYFGSGNYALGCAGDCGLLNGSHKFGGRLVPSSRPEHRNERM